MKKSKRTPFSHRIHRIIFFLVMVANIYPFLWMIINSFKSEREFTFNSLGFPKEFTWSNYVQAWEMVNFVTYFFNSILVTLLSVTVTLLFASLASFFISRFEFRFKGALLAYFSLGLIIPIHATLVSLFIEMRTLKLLGSHFTLLFPYVAFELPLAIFILAGFMSSIPKELDEAAIIDGCGIMGIFARIIMPIMVPALATAFILAFVHCWNEFSFALVLTNNDSLKTLPVGLANFSGAQTRTNTLLMAGLTIVLVPTILFILSVQKYLTAGMSAGAVKG